jgi:hypothetical protein
LLIVKPVKSGSNDSDDNDANDFTTSPSLLSTSNFTDVVITSQPTASASTVSSKNPNKDGKKKRQNGLRVFPELLKMKFR